jgi:hypothetical protein
MSNNEAFRVGLKFKVNMIDQLAPHFDEIVCHEVTDDNHAGSWGYAVAYAFKQIVETKYRHVKVNILTRFISHYFEGKHCFILTHGKDSKHLKFGFKVHADDLTVSKINQYIEENNIDPKQYWIEFSKGDSHQMLWDFCSSDYFDYMNYPAFSPSSNWVQTNYKRGRSGYVIQLINRDERDKLYAPKTFEFSHKNTGKI